MTFEAEDYLSRLKPFQRATVEHVFGRLFAETDPVDRFLVADEVGLGKTMIARGLVAKLIEHYERTDKDRRVDVLYVCSNQAIAKQNFSKIAIVGDQRDAVTDRITKLPLHVHDLETKIEGLGMAVNFIPLTPTTSLDLRSNVGRVDERALIARMLDDQRLMGRGFSDRVGAEWMFSQPAGPGSWRWQRDAVRYARIDPAILDRFRATLEKPDEDGAVLLHDVRDAVEHFRAASRRDGEENRQRRITTVGRLRRALARSCIDALEPDLIILDEFQRFPRLLNSEDPVGSLANELFGFGGAKTVLLSATPYRMFTRATELDEDHYSDFVKTTSFLLAHRDQSVKPLNEALAAYRSGLRGLQNEGDFHAVSAARDQVNERLGQVMCRTERLAATPDRGGMLDGSPATSVVPRLHADDLRQFAELDQVADTLGSQDVVEYWKSTPYPLNFMDGYQFADRFELAVNERKIDHLAHGLDTDAVRSSKPVDPGNARLRGLLDRLDAEKAWRLLWLPPSLPYYEPGEPFAGSSLTTKRLIFSAWTVVPKAIAALTSYSAERAIYATMPDGARPAVQGLAWRADGPMTEALLSLPSVSLAEIVDPRRIGADLAADGRPATREAVLERAEAALFPHLRRFKGGVARQEDRQWYAVAPLLLDEARHPGLAATWLRGAQAEDGGSVWREHRARLLRLVKDPSGLGPVPSDLAAVLARIAVAGPGTAALRALRDAHSDTAVTTLLPPALRLGLAFRALFNLPEAYAIVRTLSRAEITDEVFWRAALDYCVHGNLQAVLDEYVHVLRDWVEDRSDEHGGKPAAITDTAVEALGMTTADLTARTIESGAIGDPIRMRTRFAVRFGDGRSEDGAAVQRVDTVRKAFNSPFWPFVLATTSVGQEGLDFHLYSHAVLHWNLPSNPVDLEQREGRVHRFKGHAVRRNLAESHARDGINASSAAWDSMFGTAPSESEGLGPYWVLNGSTRIERHAMALPMSRDAQRLEDLRSLLGIYRLAFGQPRQEELLAALKRVPLIAERAGELLIDLRPAPTIR
jgi:hypothetical protein